MTIELCLWDGRTVGLFILYFISLMVSYVSYYPTLILTDTKSVTELQFSYSKDKNNAFFRGVFSLITWNAERREKE